MSEELIEDFKVNHKAIIDTLGQLQLLTRSYLEAKPKIRELERKLLPYFQSENKEFFDRLSGFYASDRPSLKMIEFLVDDLKDLKIKFLIFFERHSGGMEDRHWRDFPVDFTKFSNEILARIKIEKDYLFVLLNRI